ncbi:MAG: site-specific integrase, partial [Oligoflexus sp.]
HKALQRARVIMTEAELKDMLEKLKDFRPHVHSVVYALVHTGARKNEIRLLTWDQVDFATGYIQLHKTKNGEDRLIKMSAGLMGLLQSLSRSDRHVFLNPKGFCISAWQVDDGLAALQKTYPSIKRFRCHDLRHSFAYNFLKKGGQLYQLQAILGHKNITMTVDFYGNLKATDIEKPSPFDF